MENEGGRPTNRKYHHHHHHWTTMSNEEHFSWDYRLVRRLLQTDRNQMGYRHRSHCCCCYWDWDWDWLEVVEVVWGSLSNSNAA